MEEITLTGQSISAFREFLVENEKARAAAALPAAAKILNKTLLQARIGRQLIRFAVVIRIKHPPRVGEAVLNDAFRNVEKIDEFFYVRPVGKNARIAAEQQPRFAYENSFALVPEKFIRFF